MTTKLAQPVVKLSVLLTDVHKSMKIIEEASEMT